MTITDDSLNTPHIFPHNVDCPTTVTITETSNEKSSETKICSSTEVNQKNSQDEEVVKKLKITTTCKNSIQTTERIVVQETDALYVPKIPIAPAPTPL